jgi:hypothetical protein
MFGESQLVIDQHPLNEAAYLPEEGLEGWAEILEEAEDPF